MCGIYIIPQGPREFIVRPFNALGEDFPEKEHTGYQDLLMGLAYQLDEAPTFFMNLGGLLRELYESEGDVVFEADEELLDAIQESKIIPFNKKQ
jgi:hypothetical protein